MGGRLEGRMLPAPPWIMRRGVILGEEEVDGLYSIVSFILG